MMTEQEAGLLAAAKAEARTAARLLEGVVSLFRLEAEDYHLMEEVRRFLAAQYQTGLGVTLRTVQYLEARGYLPPTRGPALNDPGAYLRARAQQLEQRPDVVSACVRESHLDQPPTGALLGWTLVVAFSGETAENLEALMARHLLLVAVVHDVQIRFGLPPPRPPYLQDDGFTGALYWVNPDHHWHGARP